MSCSGCSGCSGELLRVLRLLRRVDWAEGEPRVISAWARAASLLTENDVQKRENWSIIPWYTSLMIGRRERGGHVHGVVEGWKGTCRSCYCIMDIVYVFCLVEQSRSSRRSVWKGEGGTWWKVLPSTPYLPSLQKSSSVVYKDILEGNFRPHLLALMSDIELGVILKDYRAFAMSLLQCRGQLRGISTQAAYEVSSLSLSLTSNAMLDSKYFFDNRDSPCPWCTIRSPICILCKGFNSPRLISLRRRHSMYSKQTNMPNLVGDKSAWAFCD
jgi:hypothetical protein